MKTNPSHKTEIARINRAIGQLEAVKRMIEKEDYCVDIMSQLRAARNAVKTIELGVLERHMNACMSEACCQSDDKQKNERIAELMELLKKYE